MYPKVNSVSGSKIRTEVTGKTLEFAFPATTSRGTLLERPTWFIKITSQEDETWVGIGEISPLPGLSEETADDVKNTLSKIPGNAEYVELKTLLKWADESKLPCVCFGVEQAALGFAHRNPQLYFENGYSKGERAIAINGLVWMDTLEKMLASTEAKLTQGFTTIKIKIGQHDWAGEHALLAEIRSRFGYDFTLRVDANGALDEMKVMEILHDLARLKVHSIEQPLPVTKPDGLRKLAAASPLPIALDEQLIGWKTDAEKEAILDFIRPQYIVIKPTLVGGLRHTQAWIKLAEERQMGWWITSSLETTWGLNALAQLCGEYENPLAHGLSTGRIFKENLDSPTKLVGAELWMERVKNEK